jgi:hypothetical protein
MDPFLDQHRDLILGTLSGFDRILFRGTLLSISYSDAMDRSLRAHHILYKDFGTFVGGLTQRIKDRAVHLAEAAGRPYLYLESATESKLFEAILKGEHRVQGFRNKDLRQELAADDEKDLARRRQSSGRITRQLRLLRAHRLNRKVSRTSYYQVTSKGHQVMATALRIRALDVARIAA